MQRRYGAGAAGSSKFYATILTASTRTHIRFSALFEIEKFQSTSAEIIVNYPSIIVRGIFGINRYGNITAAAKYGCPPGERINEDNIIESHPANGFRRRMDSQER